MLGCGAAQPATTKASSNDGTRTRIGATGAEDHLDGAVRQLDGSVPVLFHVHRDAWLAVVLLLAGCLTNGPVPSTPAAPAGPVCRHEFCVVGSNPSLAAPPGLHELVNATVPFVQLVATPRLVAWSSPDEVAGRRVGFYVYDRQRGSLYEAPLSGDDVLLHLVAHDDAVVYALGTQIADAPQIDGALRLRIYNASTGDDQPLWFDRAAAPVPLGFDGHYVFVVNLTQDGAWLVDPGARDAWPVEQGTAPATLRDGVLYVPVARNDTLGTPAQVRRVDAATRRMDVQVVATHDVQWAVPAPDGLVSDDGSALWLDTTAGSTRLPTTWLFPRGDQVQPAVPGWLLAAGLPDGPMGAPAVEWIATGPGGVTHNVTLPAGMQVGAAAAAPDAGFLAVYNRTADAFTASLWSVAAP